MKKIAAFIASGSGMGADEAKHLSSKGYDVAIMSSSGKGEELAKRLGGFGYTGSNLSSKDIKFKKPKLNKKNLYKFNNLDIEILTRKNLKNLSKNDMLSTTAILKGNILDSKGKKVISYGEIVKSCTLKILSDKFYIKKPITILNVKKNKNRKVKNFKFIK